MSRRRTEQGGRPPVFVDPTRRRARLLGGLAVVAAIVGAVWVGLFWIGIYVLGALPPAPPPQVQPHVAAVTQPGACAGAPLQAGDLPGRPPGLSVHAVLRGWPDGAVPAFVARCDGLRSVFVEWFRIDLGRLTVDRTVARDAMDAVLRAAASTGPDRLRITPILRLPLPVLPGAEVLADPAARTRLVAAMTDLVAAQGHDGLCLSPEGLRPRHLPGLVALMADLRPNLAALGARLCLVGDAEGTLWQDPALLAQVDRVLFTAFARPASGAPPAPLAPNGWFEDRVAGAVAAVGTDRLIVALGALAVGWTDGADPRPMPYAQAMGLAARHGGMVAFSPHIGNTHVTLTDDSGAAQDIWVLDAASLWNQMAVARDQGVRHMALWSAGSEDPGVWPLLRARPGAGALQALGDVVLDHHVAYLGAGPFLRPVDAGADGQRRLFIDPITGRIIGQRLDALPRPVTLERHGQQPGRLVALSFDDGPDPGVTAAILDILRDRGVPGAFFVVGRNMARHPDLVRRMVDEGHEVGSHTFYHPEAEAVGDLRLVFELNAVQRLLASITGRGTTLFRSPYGRSEGPVTAAEARSLLRVLDRGYVAVGADIVPRDWEGLDAPAIVDQVVAEVQASPGSKVIVLHDAGGDRAQTLAAIGPLIDRLRAQGHQFVALGTLLGQDRDSVMPPRRDALTALDGLSFAVMAHLGAALQALFWVAVLAGGGRAILMLALAALRRPHRPAPAVAASPPPRVAVAIPAFNEEAVIERSVAAALASDWPGLRVIVVDDGSTDATTRRVEDRFGADPRVTLIRQPNGGKWAAMNAAHAAAEGADIVLGLDADAVLMPGALERLAAHFADPAVGAVAGNVRVGNRVNLLTRLQSLEYVTAQNIDRRAAERLGAMLVVPGAVGAWRRAAVAQVGGYSPDTLTEDADLTVSILRAGWRVVYEPRALSLIEAPQRVRPLLRQRLRWTYGMMQTAWKHRRAARQGHPVGLVAIPDLWLAGVALGLLAPLADLVFLGVLLDMGLDLAAGRPSDVAPHSVAMAAGWLALPLIEALALLAALLWERDEPLWQVLLVPVQRLVYRPLLYVTVWRAVLRAATGTLVHWGKLARLGTVRAPGG